MLGISKNKLETGEIRLYKVDFLGETRVFAILGDFEFILEASAGEDFLSNSLLDEKFVEMKDDDSLLMNKIRLVVSEQIAIVENIYEDKYFWFRYRYWRAKLGLGRNRLKFFLRKLYRCVWKMRGKNKENLNRLAFLAAALKFKRIEDFCVYDKWREEKNPLNNWGKEFIAEAVGGMFEVMEVTPGIRSLSILIETQDMGYYRVILVDEDGIGVWMIDDVYEVAYIMDEEYGIIEVEAGEYYEGVDEEMMERIEERRRLVGII